LFSKADASKPGALVLRRFCNRRPMAKLRCAGTRSHLFRDAPPA